MDDWPEIVAQHGEAVWQAAFRVLGNEADAADCVQETFAAAVKLARREPIRNWAALLRRVGNMQALGMLRQRSRRRKHYEGTKTPEIPDPGPGPAEQAQTYESAQALRRALARLPEQQAAVFTLRYLEDLSYEQIAETLGLSSSGVGVLLHRAKGKLRHLMLARPAPKQAEVQHD
jgi:RNA polymerase sigma-70 factor (ECF subfamily)